MDSKKNENHQTSRCGSITGETYLFNTATRRRRSTFTQRNYNTDSGHSSRFDPPRSFSLDSTTKAQENSKDGTTENPNQEPRFNKSFHHYRFIVVMMGGFSFGIMILLRFNISVAILNMVNQTALYLADNPNKTIDDFLSEGYSLGGEFIWDNEIQQMIMSYYMFAYTLPQVFTTKLGLIVGNRLAIPISLSICGLSTILTPMAAYQGWQYVIALRLINGIGASAVLPLMLNLIETWMPYDEITLGLTCAQILQASLVTLNPLISGQLSAIHWSHAFYVPGVITLIYSFIWVFLVTDQPDENSLISQRELDLICGCPDVNSSAGATDEGNTTENQVSESNSGQQDEQKGDWKQVFGIPSFYAYIFMWCLYSSTYNSFSFILPNYLRQFLKISVAENGIFCTMIQSGCIVSVLWPHPMMEFLKANFKISQTGSRRATYVLISLMVSGTWIYVGLLHESQLLLLFINRCFQSSTDIVVTGSIMANFAKAGLSGLVFSMVNTIGNLSVVVASPMIGRILDITGQSRDGWGWIYSAMGCSQWLILLPFSTMIRSDPIEFKKEKKKSEGSEHSRRIDSIPEVDLERGDDH